MKNLQFVSDIHLEFYKKKIPIINPICEGESYLALLGDIGYPILDNYGKFIEYHSKYFKEIIIIAGNHEFYSGKSKQRTISDVKEKIVNICLKYTNVTFLDNSSKLIGNTLFIGSTLWSDVQCSKTVIELMNDYNKIYVKSDEYRSKYIYRSNPYGMGGTTKKIFIKRKRDILSPSHVRSMHNEAINYIKSEINQAKTDNIIILTHHAPSFKLLDEIDIRSTCYATDLESLMNNTKINHWLFGHIHHNVNINIGDVKCISNCMGYIGEFCERFDEKKFIEFE